MRGDRADPRVRLFGGVDRGGAPQVALVAQRVYRLRDGAAAEPLAVAPPFRPEPGWAEGPWGPAFPRLLHDGDRLAPLGLRADVLVSGAACAPGGRPVARLDVRVRVGPVALAIRVHGDRRAEAVGRDGLRFGRAEPFVRLPLDAERAYGGVDAPRGRPADASTPHHPANWCGRAFIASGGADRLDGAPLPNLEDPAAPLDAAALLPGRRRVLAAPVLLELDPFALPRAAGWSATGPGVAEAPEAFFQAAPPSLAAPRLAGDEPYRLEHLHPERPCLVGRLPADPPRLWVDWPGVGRRELPARLARVRFEPEAERVTLLWSGVLPLLVPLDDEALAPIAAGAVWSRPGPVPYPSPRSLPCTAA